MASGNIMGENCDWSGKLLLLTEKKLVGNFVKQTTNCINDNIIKNMESNCKVYDLFENIWKTLHEGNIMQDIVLHNVLKVLKNILEL
ncbi:hypothetical protein Phum_PHUM197250 [Pediculus humanus corporis]|uniref:Uncharacterized protein n=1 Tax=Pediculus humanus subsp. corporis TaxID=121224 RepID=E0VH14_PEDHC|nr:uncharacterized protein Phum_PHUM197250 [Pediculus humanus corporis]EEB12670.1 hypothetical protein Phum_PHUM197250 [Pediculus humanus corporis]